MLSQFSQFSKYLAIINDVNFDYVLCIVYYYNKITMY